MSKKLSAVPRVRRKKTRALVPITMYGLELAWRLRTVTCPECATSMHLTEADVKALREGVIAARVRLDVLSVTAGGMDRRVPRSYPYPFANTSAASLHVGSSSCCCAYLLSSSCWRQSQRSTPMHSLRSTVLFTALLSPLDTVTRRVLPAPCVLRQHALLSLKRSKRP